MVIFLYIHYLSTSLIKLCYLGIMGSRKWITEPDEYICNLSKETQIIAKEELREDEYTRQSALSSMREWIMQNPKIRNIRMGR